MDITKIKPLTGPALPPVSKGKPQQIVVMLHGVGADGNDLISLAPLLAQALPDALFVSPDGPQAYDMAPMGRQWFSLQERSMAAMLAGVQSSAPILDKFIDLLLQTHDLSENRLALFGFSQGTMMGLHVALRRQNRIAGMVGFSGMLIGSEILAAEITSYPPILLVHGEEDEIVPYQSLAITHQALEAVNVKVAIENRPGLGHGIDAQGIKVATEFLTDILT